MVKKIILGVVLFLVIAIGYLFMTSSKQSPFDTASYSNQGLEISVDYCRPYKKGRVIFGEESEGALLPNGVYWRLGANAATEITFITNVTFAGKAVEAGTYRMYAVPNSSSFEVSLNSGLDTYFAVSEPDYELDVLKVNVPTSKGDAEVEQFTINFESNPTGVNMNFVWDKMIVSVPISKQ